MTSNGPDATADAWLARSQAALERTPFRVEVGEIGRVNQIADGIARVSGLPHVKLNELLRFADGSVGFALSLDAAYISVVLLDDTGDIAAGSEVHATGEVLQVPVGEALLGRVVDPLGRPLDRDEPIEPDGMLPIERLAPAIIERALVNEPLDTGILVIDSLFPIGRGQRELIIGDRATGKTSLAVDTIINQKHSDVICVYVAVGQRARAVQQVIESVQRHGDPSHCIFVVAAASATAGLQWTAPFAGFSVAEYFRDRGQHALVVIDDLSQHAATHRELALLTHEPPGREAYPGDIFYLHARLLERAAKLSTERGSGSLTALPIAQTDAGNLSAYIPTNLISITDGQIVLDAHLAAANQRPSVDVGLSVSRVGGKAQPRALRDVSGRLRLEYSQFQELEMFTRFGGLSDDHVKQQILRGRVIRTLLTQPRFDALRRIDQIALLVALAESRFDTYPLPRIARLRARLPTWLDARLGNDMPEASRLANEPLDDSLRRRLVDEVQALVDDMASQAT
ncbi:F0F1 ATP synthase subunit alpha [Modicisalibacter xianhensis]|uniref:ATP synthase subunit alpha n=1 Tax=Modicisalibacter xianhensis TaxID=442341 RepID=A0A1I2ZZ39_9GAMM|nr:F0F1 ATP synthase subunit alpha [Halomonas xianhensis]SFH43162.1 F-type H+-transporting ATPase subunit alpha [Halomonas xianhensis]